jgi:ketosteroid isomerase-like protein
VKIIKQYWKRRMRLSPKVTIRGFLSFCSDDTQWTFVGDKTLRGKEALRQYMAKTYIELPKFTVTNLTAEGDFVTALGKITLKDDNGKMVDYTYCDVWRFYNGKIAELMSFVIEAGEEKENSSEA